MKQMTSDAVSPVVGVMLMLVVTIIIAAVVSAFAGGLGGSQQKTPQVTIQATPVIQAFDNGVDLGVAHTTGFTAANGIKFANAGGDTFSLSDINVHLVTGGTSYTITPADTIDYAAAGTVLPAGITIPNGFGYDASYNSVPTSWGYFAKIGNTSVTDATIGPGDSFMLYADGQYDSSDSSYGPSASNGKYLVWAPTGAIHGVGAQFGTKVAYTLIDRTTSKPMASGYVVFQ